MKHLWAAGWLVLTAACVASDDPSADDLDTDTDAPSTDETDTTDDTDDVDTDGIDTDDVDTDLPEICTAAETRCADAATLEVCSEDGTAWTSFPCVGVCDDEAVPAACGLADLEGWDLHLFVGAVSGTRVDPSYTFEDDGTVAIQGANALPSAYVNTVVRENTKMAGRVSVNTASDDDLIGFVFGWQDPEHFYLVDWKKASQPDVTCGTASAGVTLKKIAASAEIASCATLWSSTDVEGMTALVPTADNPAGWVSSTTYTFEISHRPGNISIVIKTEEGTEVASLTSTDTTYASGRMGFYNYSQAAVRYELVTFEPLP